MTLPGMTTIQTDALDETPLAAIKAKLFTHLTSPRCNGT